MLEGGTIDAREGAGIAIVGVGAIGGAIAADLSDVGRHPLTLCVRTPIDRLVVEHPSGETRVEARIAQDPEALEPVDWVLLATKAHQSEGARAWLAALCNPETKVAVLQNGIDHVERVSPLVPPGTSVLPVVIHIPAEKTAPGRVRQSRDGLLRVPDDEVGRAFAQLFQGGRTAVKPTDDFITQAWWKLASNAALGGVCALVLRENGAVREPALHALVLSLMREVVEVARAEGARLPDDAPEKALERIVGGAPDHWSSITVDRREGRAMEWRTRNEIVGTRGRRHGIATPLNDLVTTLLRVADEGAGGLPS